MEAAAPNEGGGLLGGGLASCEPWTTAGTFASWTLRSCSTNAHRVHAMTLSAHWALPTLAHSNVVI